MQNEKYHTVRPVLKSNRKIEETENIYTPIAHIHEHSLCWLGTANSINKNGMVKLVLMGPNLGF